MFSPSSLFICGTDTGVGKTVITAALCARANAHGLRAGAFKPLESGCQSGKSSLKRHLHRADSEFLKKISGMDDPLDLINPYYFKEPLAPGVAAKREKKIVSLRRIESSFKTLQKKYDQVFVEGAGGLLVPIAGKKTNLDLIQLLQIPVLLVARLGLGTINHTLLTLAHLKQHKIPVVGVVLNQTTRECGIAEKTNPAVLKQYGVQIILFPHLGKITREALIKALPTVNTLT